MAHEASLRYHMSGNTTSKKMGPRGVLTNEEEGAICTYIEEMVDCGLP